MVVQKPKINYIEIYIQRHIWCLSIFESDELESKYIIKSLYTIFGSNVTWYVW